MSGTAEALASYAFPTPVTYGYPNIGVFAISEAREVAYKWRTLSSSGGDVWNPTDNSLKGLGGAVSPSQNGVFALSRVTGDVDVFMVFNNDTQLYRTYYNGSTWSGWENTQLGLSLKAGAGGASMDSGRVDLFLITQDYRLW